MSRPNNNPVFRATRPYLSEPADPRLFFRKYPFFVGVFIIQVSVLKKKTKKPEPTLPKVFKTVALNTRFIYFGPILVGPPGAPAGVYVDDQSVTSSTARIIWTVTSALEHGAPIYAYDVEAETLYDPGVWKIISSSKFKALFKTTFIFHFLTIRKITSPQYLSTNLMRFYSVSAGNINMAPDHGILIGRYRYYFPIG